MLAALRRGVAVQQFLGREGDGDAGVVRWLTVRPASRTVKVVRHEVQDVGTDDFMDVSEFPPVDEDEYTGEGQVVATADSPEDALAECVALGAAPGRWGNEGLVDAEYAEARRGT